MEQYLIYQVKINLLQQSIATFDNNQPHSTEQFNKIAADLLALGRELLQTDNTMYTQEYIPQIEYLCVLLNEKRNFLQLIPTF